jgi:hypothetical protein
VTNNFVAPYRLILAAPSSPTFSPRAELAFLKWAEGPVPPALRAMFDVFIDSSEVGMRKPERRIYELALRMGGEKLAERGGGDGDDTALRPEEVVMIDDLGMSVGPSNCLNRAPSPGLRLTLL